MSQKYEIFVTNPNSLSELLDMNHSTCLLVYEYFSNKSLSVTKIVSFCYEIAHHLIISQSFAKFVKNAAFLIRSSFSNDAR